MPRTTSGWREHAPNNEIIHLVFELSRDGLKEETANICTERDVQGSDDRREGRNERQHHLPLFVVRSE